MTSYKKVIFSLGLAVLMLGTMVIPQTANAQFADVIGGPTTIVKFVWEKIEKVYDTVQGIVGAELSNRTVNMFLDSMAYDVATELATGGAGGNPQFRTVSIKEALRNSQDKALGDFLGELTNKGFDELGINLCDPSLELKLTLTLNILDEEQPSRPNCDWNNVRKNWEQFDDNLQANIVRFQLDTRRSGVTSTAEFFKGLVSKESSDLGIAFTLSDRLAELQQEAKEVNQLTAIECQGYIDKATPVTDEVIAHCSQLKNISTTAWLNAWSASRDTISERKYEATNTNLSDIIKDAANKFTNTFFSKLMKNWIKKGTWSLFGSTDNDIYQNYRTTLIDRLRGGSDIRQPRNSDIFKDLVTVNVESIDDFSYLNDFAICTNEFRGPDNCVMSPAFLQAVNSNLTLRQAIEQKVIIQRESDDIPFIHPDDHQNNTVDKCHRDALCYSNLVKLRKANIIPVGWELAALRAPVSLKQAMDCFEDGPQCDFDVSSEFAVDGNDHNPFYHLVDPDWVLKAPAVRCDAYAYSSILKSSEGSNRQQYCADPKVCLREDADGNCIGDQYNYCVRSENIWNFDANICQAGEIYSGCLTFSNDDFGNNSYIQDTLEYCTSDQAGCLRYSQDKDSTGQWVLDDIATDSNDLFLNKQALDCDLEDVGCSEYIVMTTDLGVNLVPNGGFDDFNGDGFPDGWTGADGSTLADGIDDPTGSNNTNNIALDYDGDRLPNGYTAAGNYNSSETVKSKLFLQPNTNYKLSVDVAQYDDIRNYRARVTLTMCDDDSGCNELTTPADSVDGVGDCYFNVGGHQNNVDMIVFPEDTEMERRECSFTTNEFVDYAFIELIGMPWAPDPDDQAAIWFDNLKVEAVSSIDQASTPYSDYGRGAKIYMNDDAVMCLAEEVGCQGYIPSNGDPMIPAVIVQDDLCPAECVGYDTFSEQVNIFDIIEGDNFVEYYNFIPETARQCPDQEIGCEEFTNLDVVAEGGEGREYFSYLRQCVGPDLGSTYYTWEGTEVAGYQIKTWDALGSNLNDAPCTNMAPAGNTCLDNIFVDDGITEPNEVAACGPDTADPSDDPINNPNCREFFDIDGNVFYRLQDRVIFATDNCHDYRRTATDQVYKAVPEESISCSAVNNGCSSYYGNNSNNLRLLVSDNFEQGTYAPWIGISGSSVDLSNESLNNNGHSLQASVGNVFARNMNNVSLQNNKEYIISWWMKSEVSIDQLDMSLLARDLLGNSFSEIFADPNIESTFRNIEAGKWHYYTASTYLDQLDTIDVENIDRLELQIQTAATITGQNLYIDNFIIKEVENSFAVIKNSWDTPASCDAPYEGYHLGCQSYRDLNGQNFDLKSFDSLCREEAIGCTPVIDTQNSINSLAETFHLGDYSEITVPADQLTYLVPDTKHYCSSEFKGCTELGLPDRLDSNEFTTEYKINDPDKYNTILCDSEGLNCTEYNTSKGVFYLKDPGAGTCTYQKNILIEGSLLSGWFKTSSLVDAVPLGCADTDGNPYTNLGTYDVGELILPRDYCSVSETNPTQIFYFTKYDCEANAGYWNNYLTAAQCPASENLCTTFKDPVDPLGCDPKGSNLAVGDTCSSNLYDNQTDCENNGYIWTLESKDGYCNSSVYNNERDCVNNGWQWTPYCENYYYYDDSNIEDAACNGLVDRQDGCVLFYDANNWNGEHSQIVNLYDAAETYEDVEAANNPSSPVSCDPDFDPNCQLNSNRLIKVQKDRQCAEWLACKSSVASLDASTEEYKIICDDLDTCLEFQYDPDSNTTKCKKWGSYDEDVEALTFEKYQSRDTGIKNHIAWSDKEYTGYSIPNTLPISELVVYDFGQDDDQMTRLVYNVVDSTDFVGSYYEACVDSFGNSLDGQACSATLNSEGDYYFRGECQDRVCWVSPKVNTNSTSTFALETRAYSIADAPFPAAIEPNGIQRLSKYDQANICSSEDSSPNACELSFKKVTFGNNQEVYYYPEDAEAGEIPNGICVSGDTTVEVNGQTVPRECNENSDCDSKNNDAAQSSRGDGNCALRSEEIVFKNWPGICLEYDLDNPVTKDGSNSYYCNQWYPAQKIKGTDSLYDNYRDSGYFDASGRDALFCAVAEPYVVSSDRFYCGYFTAANECNVLLKVPAGSQVDLNLASQYSELLDEGSWMEYNPNLITPASETAVGKDIIVTTGYTKFNRITDFNNVLPNVSNFMEIINNMFDAPDGIHRFYWDDGVSPNGSDSWRSFVNLPTTDYRAGGQCQDCPVIPCPADYHFVRQTCTRGGNCGTHRWRNVKRWCNPLLYNYYVDINTPVEIFELPDPVYEGSCAADCRFLAVDNEDANHGRGCFQNSSLAPTYSSILTNFASSTLAGQFDLDSCVASSVNNNDCAFVSCVQTLTIENQNISHSCNLYSECFRYIFDDAGALMASATLQADTERCIEEAWEVATPLYDDDEYSSCLADNEDDFTNRIGGLDQEALVAFCSSCILEDVPETYDTISTGINCDEIDPINCYQQCRIITHLDSEGLLSAVRTDIWYRSEQTNERINKAFPWISWYADPSKGYVSSDPSPSASDDEVLYSSIAAFPNVAGNYPENFSHFGAGLDIFNPDSIVSTRVPYHKVSPDNTTVGTFFSYYDSSGTLDEALDIALLQMQDIFYRVYNLNWSSADNTYQYYKESLLDGGNHSNPFAGPDYSPRVLSVCGEGLCETVDSDGKVIGVEEGITVNSVNDGTLIGLEGSLFVNAKFFYHAHPDHMPVYSIDMDWGDSVNNFSLNPGKYKNSLPEEYCAPNIEAPGDANALTPNREPQLMGFAGEDRACQSGYKVFYHDYLYDDTRNHDCNGLATGAPGTPAKPIIANASCYQPRIRVMDNWGWFSVVPFDGWIVVYDE